ncbi:MAG: HAMP domain-containing histidine kinase [Bacteroidales bacterium]|nr:HAMP domain-containing histidine kinase [Bacteroidales bacterium]MCF8455841.1 HAMP domain-containing histidine kinase [Bacteroidales bacterium]
MRGKEKIFVGLIGFLLIVLLILQYAWMQNLLHIKKDKFDTELIETVHSLLQEYEESFYCVDLSASQHVSRGDTLIGLTLTESGIDTIDYLAHFQYAPDTSMIFKRMTYPLDAEVHHIVHIEFILPVDSTQNSKKDSMTSNLYPGEIQSGLAGYPIKVDLLESNLFEKVRKLNENINFSFALFDTENKELQLYRSDDYENDFQNLVEVEAFADNYFFKSFTVSIKYSGFFFEELKSNLFMILSTLGILVLLIILIIRFLRLGIHQKKLSDLKSDFIHNMAHEFKTPISNINLAIDTIVLQNENSSPKSSRYASIIKEETERLNENVNKFLEISAVEKESLRLNLQVIDFHDMLDRLIGLQNIQPNGTSLKIEKDFQAEIFQTLADEAHIANAILNLLDNAIKYSGEKKEIFVSTKKSNHSLQILIRDNGIGIDTKQQKNIFDRFYRVPAGKQHDVKGFGLGLYYVKQVVEAHKGEIKLKSSVGKGSTFILILPLK